MDIIKVTTAVKKAAENSLIQKAFLCVADVNEIQSSAKENQVSAIEKAAAALEQSYRQMDKKARGKDFKKAAKNAGFKIMKVQFNPEELSFQVTPEKQDEASDQSEVEAASQTLPIIMNVTLQLDDEWGAVMTQANGISSLLGNVGTRHVMFCWGDMIMSGILKSVTVTYTKFRDNGLPIRGAVAMEMQLVHGGTKSSTLKFWDKSFDQLFKVKYEKSATDKAKDAASKMLKFNL